MHMRGGTLVNKIILDFHLEGNFNYLCEYFILYQRIAGEIKSFSTDGWVAPKLAKRMDKFMLYMLTAGKKALADGGMTEEVMNVLDKTRCGVLIGSAMGGMKVINIYIYIFFFLLVYMSISYMS